MRIPVEKSIYRKVYLQLRTGFLTERPLFYDAVRLNPPMVFSRSPDKLPNLQTLQDQLIRDFMNTHGYHFEDFVSDNPESTQHVAYNYAKKQMNLMNRGMSKKEARDIVEKEFQNEMATMKARLETGIPTATVESLNEPKSSMSVKDLKGESPFVNTLIRSVQKQQTDKINHTIDRAVNEFSKQYGNHVIIEKLRILERGKEVEKTGKQFTYFNNGGYDEELGNEEDGGETIEEKEKKA